MSSCFFKFEWGWTLTLQELVYVVAGTILNVVYFNQAFGALIGQSDFIMSVCNAAMA